MEAYKQRWTFRSLESRARARARERKREREKRERERERMREKLKDGALNMSFRNGIPLCALSLFVSSLSSHTHSLSLSHTHTHTLSLSIFLSLSYARSLAHVVAYTVSSVCLFRLTPGEEIQGARARVCVCVCVDVCDYCLSVFSAENKNAWAQANPQLRRCSKLICMVRSLYLG